MNILYKFQDNLVKYTVTQLVELDFDFQQLFEYFSEDITFLEEEHSIDINDYYITLDYYNFKYLEYKKNIIMAVAIRNSITFQTQMGYPCYNDIRHKLLEDLCDKIEHFEQNILKTI